MGLKKGTSVEEVMLMRRLSKINVGEVFKFKVTDVNDEFSLSELIESPAIKGKVIYKDIGNFGINGLEWFDVDDVFEARVVRKDINRTLIINPIWNLREMKVAKKQEDMLERWMNGGK